MSEAMSAVSDHVDTLAYAVALFDGAQRIAASARNEPIEKIGIPFHLLVGFSIENGLKALLQYQLCPYPKQWRRSHDLTDLLSRTKQLEARLWPDAADSIRHPSRYHKEHWFRYPERAETANVYTTQTTLILVDQLLRQVSALTDYRP